MTHLFLFFQAADTTKITHTMDDVHEKMRQDFLLNADDGMDEELAEELSDLKGRTPVFLIHPIVSLLQDVKNW